jgi:hypothetical protein
VGEAVQSEEGAGLAPLRGANVTRPRRGNHDSAKSTRGHSTWLRSQFYLGSGGGSNLERRPSALALRPSGSTATVRGRDHREPTVSLTSPSRDSLLSGKAKVQPRSAASSSEPALVPGANYADEGVRTVRLIPGRHSTSSPNRDRDITTDDLASTKFPTRGSIVWTNLSP